MWIRTQENALINLDNVLKIDIVKLNHGNMNNRHVMAGNQILGTYATEQRALEVLDEIHKFLRESNTIRYEYYGEKQIDYTYIEKTVYVMPKE